MSIAFSPTTTPTPKPNSPHIISEKVFPRASRIDSALSQHTIGGTPRATPAKLKAWEISSTARLEPASFNTGPPKSDTEVNDYLTSKISSTNQDASQIFIVEQKHSRGSLDTHAGDVKLLLDHLHAFPSLSKALAAFSRDGSDCYKGKASAHFSPAIEDTHLFELCCVLKYVERNERLSPLEAAKGSEDYNEVQRWSLRQMAFYQSHRADRSVETALLVNPSSELWTAFKAAYRDGPADSGKPYEDWMRIPLRVFDSLTASWPAYVTALHRAVEEVKNDASFTDPRHQRINEADTKSLETCVELMDRLKHARHVLANNISILETALREAKKRQEVLTNPSKRDLALFESGVEDVILELQFHRNQVDLIVGRLDRTSATIASLISLRGSYNMERMTARSILEARAVRIIALVTLCFLPPTFTSGFLDTNTLSITKSESGHLVIDARPEFFFFLALTLPLMAITVGGWLLWDWYSMRKARREQPSILDL